MSYRPTDHLTECALAKTIIVLIMGILLGIHLSDPGSFNLADTSAVPWHQWAQLLLGFGALVLVQTAVGINIPRAIAICSAKDCTRVLGWHLLISWLLLWPLLWAMCLLKRYTYRPG